MEPTQRFTQVAAIYDQYRPSYPEAVVQKLALSPTQRVAEIGSGTGILTRQLLATGASIFAIEPNAAMRVFAEQRFGDHPNFTSLDARAEATGLSDHSQDWVVAAQAFHWFKLDETRLEFERILKPGGQVALIWNDRQSDDPLLSDYENLLTRYCDDYQDQVHRLVKLEDLDTFLPGYQVEVFPNHQRLDWEGLQGRLLSCSYALRPDHANFEALMQGLRDIFERHQKAGEVVFPYDTRLFTGQFL